jgi:hypothetical protein
VLLNATFSKHDSILRSIVTLSMPSGILCLVVAETFFRLVLPASQTPVTRLAPGPEGIYLYDIDGPRTGVTTVGPWARHRRSWRINNAGWRSDIDYFPAGARRRPLIAIVGDSYIDARQVEPKASIAGVLRRQMAGAAEVYGFGISGAPLSQYLQTSRYVDREFSPDVLVVMVVHNDLDESLRTFMVRRAFWQIEPSRGSFAIVPPDLGSHPWRKTAGRLLLHSALFRYAYLNLGGQGLFSAGTRADVYARLAADPRAYSQLQRDIISAIDFLVGRFQEATFAGRLLFMIDAPRADLYGGPEEFKNVVWMNEAVSAACSARGIPLLDLTEAFTESYRATGVPLSSVEDYHWDETGHRVAAEALRAFLTARRALPGQTTSR